MYDLQRSPRQCAVTGRPLREGEVYYAVLREEDGKLVRQEYCADAWSGPPADAFSFWKGRVPVRAQAPRPQTDPDVLLEFFERLRERRSPATDSLLYILALLLMRKRVLKLVDVVTQGNVQALMVECPRNGCRYSLADPGLSTEELAAQEAELQRLLEGGAMEPPGDFRD